MKKRIVCMVLLLSMLILCLASCIRIPEPLPSDFVEGDEIVVRSKAYAKSVEIYSMDSDFILSDNFFDMNKGEVKIKVLSGKPKGLKVRSVFDIN